MLGRWIGATYQAVTGLRNFSFDQGFLRVRRAKVPVISLGNLTFGGTGKTPITARLAKDLSARGLRVGIVSRGYGRTSSGARLVEIRGAPGDIKTMNDRSIDAELFGDEPVWYKKNLPNVLVAVASRRIDACRLIEGQVDVILGDDSYQHRWLHRDANILLFDMSAPDSEWQLPPLGRLREAAIGIGRATDIFLTKVNLASRLRSSELGEIQTQLSFSKTADDIKKYQDPKMLASRVLSWNFAISNFTDELGVELVPSKIGSSPRILIVSAIAQPDSFESLLKQKMANGVFVEHVKFADHFRFAADDIMAILKKAKDLSVDWIVCTEKDMIKLSPLIAGKSAEVMRGDDSPLPDESVLFDRGAQSAKGLGANTDSSLEQRQRALRTEHEPNWAAARLEVQVEDSHHYTEWINEICHRLGL
jgi:tetraacyldisaccharide 4'-kinase